MIPALLGLTAIMVVGVGWLLRQTVNVKPWLESAAGPVAEGWTQANVKTGLGVFATVATSFFALFISAYFMRRQGMDWRPVAVPTVLWLNTAILIAASALFQRARYAARRKTMEALRNSLLAGGILTWIFLLGQSLAWRQLTTAGFVLTANPANAFFYVLTALHGLHLLGGLWVWGATTVKLQLGHEPGAVRLSVELCTFYWHFLLGVWLVLFAVLLST